MTPQEYSPRAGQVFLSDELFLKGMEGFSLYYIHSTLCIYMVHALGKLFWGAD